MEPSFPCIKNLLLLDSDGKRVAGKYFSNDWPTEASKLKFEKEMFAKARESSNVARSKTDIAMIGEFIVVYRFARDLRMFVTGGGDENEVILATVLEGFADAVGIVLRNNVEKRAVLESMDRIVLCMDEMIDGGIILETRGSVVAAGKTDGRGKGWDAFLKLFRAAECVGSACSSKKACL